MPQASKSSYLGIRAEFCTKRVPVVIDQTPNIRERRQRLYWLRNNSDLSVLRFVNTGSWAGVIHPLNEHIAVWRAAKIHVQFIGGTLFGVKYPNDWLPQEPRGQPLLKSTVHVYLPFSTKTSKRSPVVKSAFYRSRELAGAFPNRRSFDIPIRLSASDSRLRRSPPVNAMSRRSWSAVAASTNSIRGCGLHALPTKSVSVPSTLS